MRLRIPELLAAQNMTAYGLWKAARGRMSAATAYRLVRLEGRLHSFNASLCETLCEVLRIEPGDLFERDRRRKVRKP